MAIFFSHTTATECWRSGRFDTLLGGPSISRAHRPAGSIQVEHVATMLAMDRLGIIYGDAFAFNGGRPHESSQHKPSARKIRELRDGVLSFASDPLHVLVPNKQSVNAIRSITCHVRLASLPTGSFVRMAPNLFLCSPEFCFLQMAANAPFIQLVKLGFELCSLYTLQPDGRADYGRVLPPTTVRALKAYLEMHAGSPGSTAARKALRYVAVASGSPMETALAIILCLPPRLGGYGFPLPHMNYRIEQKQAGRRGMRKSYYLCDLLWPEANVCIEYDSDLEHTGPSRIAKDAQRRNDLLALGVTTITATRGQVMSGEGLDRIAQQLGRMLGLRVRSERGWSTREREQLFRSLVTAKDMQASWTKARQVSLAS